ncbi:MAG: hypothetical protein QXY87_12315 [Saccharolobus sp.]|uniref:Integral membrane protein n=1 Tax=Saccharolobus shibatae (strain ATCC 51178 / DSM 5389 / JCM 8931 / NBRC 15437 / B12) TaxID=523848 RepID=A0A8F5BMN0_SACSH|nr:hypothetical protein [Saccharolobus shibatae]MCH4815887.1 hypothetical protein [Saccharolobus shibatae]QXJ28099.1 putative integral membrane protein [Saccharolobus shibatae B12]
MLTTQELIVIFVISFITNATPFFGAPYTLITTSILIKSGVSPLSLILAIVLSGLGASLSKLVMYALGIAIRKPLKNNKNILFIEKISKSYGFYIALLILSILPILPLDDYIFLAGGIAKLSVFKMVVVSIISKIIKSAIEISVELAGISLLASVLGINAFELSLISILVFVLLGILLFKLDWEQLLRKGEKFLREKLKINL